MVHAVFEIYHLQKLPSHIFPLVGIHFLKYHRKHDILFCAQDIDEVELLEYEAYLPAPKSRKLALAHFAGILPVKENIAPAWRIKAAHHIHRSGFSASAWPLYGYKIPLIDRKVETLQCSDIIIAHPVDLPDVRELDNLLPFSHYGVPLLNGFPTEARLFKLC